MTVLVTAASKHGATAEIAQIIGETLVAAGIDARVLPADQVDRVDGYDAVVLGSAVYMGKWLEDATRLVGRNLSVLAGMPVWLFSSGPLGDPPRPTVEPDDAAPMLLRTHARDHRTFSGRLVRSDLGLGERAITKMVGVPTGDFIPRETVRQWAAGIAQTLLAERTPATA